jgi:hypothetical protein
MIVVPLGLPHATVFFSQAKVFFALVKMCFADAHSENASHTSTGQQCAVSGKPLAIYIAALQPWFI